MREIVVISGKGGTGKTTISSSFALLKGEKVVVDADVDAPDLYIILSPKAVEAYNFRGRKTAVIDTERCTACGTCRELCRFDAISEGFSVDPVLCEGCALCFFACPRDAVSMVERVSGMWFVAHSRAGLMLHARLSPGEENSGKLITQLKKTARELAQERGIDLVLVDGPPGVGCPVISSITGATDVVIVTEPTPSGIHDLERVVELCRHFGVRMWLVINRFDMNPDRAQQIEDWASSQGIELLGRLPFDGDIPRIQAAGRAPVEVPDSFCGELIKEMWEKLLEV